MRLLFAPPGLRAESFGSLQVIGPASVFAAREVR